MIWLAIALVASLAAGACGSSDATPDATASPGDCLARCATKAQACGAPADRAAAVCGSLCPRVTSAAQLACLEGSSCAQLTAVFDQTSTVCGIGGGPPVDAGVGGAFGDACTCPGSGGSNGSVFECRGTNICSPGLSCIGQIAGGISSGRCRGPTCCSGTADCATKLGSRSSCAADQRCVCTFGDLECVGTACTCEGGVPATRGLCYPGTAP